MQVELRHGAYQDVLQDVFCDSCIGDPPYGAATHEGHNRGRPQIMSATGQATGRALLYDAWTPEDVFEFVSFWTPRTRQWMAIFTSDDLTDAYNAKVERGAPIVGAKPIATMLEIVRDYSDPGFTVVDPCAGWGSTLIAAAQSGRIAVGAEANVETFRAAQVRFGLLG